MSETARKNSNSPVGILGGTFDPVHRAHVQLAEDACKQLGLSQVLWIPSGHPPHRDAPRASAEQRLAMVALAIQGHDGFVLDANEVSSTAPSYTVTTLLRLRAIHGKKPLVLLLGADAFLGLASWHRWHELFTLAHIAVATRPGYALDPGQMSADLRKEYQQRHIEGATDYSGLAMQPAGSIVTFAITPLDISASTIRTRLESQHAAGQEIQDLLPTAVLDYIAHNHLYSGH
jgi:nicotinate-nucleotide adenylyltransferase